MIDGLTKTLDFHSTALMLRSERSRVLAGNLANADTPDYKARDFDFRQALVQATGMQSLTAATPAARTNAGHLTSTALGGGGPSLLYRTPLQTSLDGNTVDLDMERANFADNTLRYEASLRFLNGQIRTLMLSINGQ